LKILFFIVFLVHHHKMLYSKKIYLIQFIEKDENVDEENNSSCIFIHPSYYSL
jgi:hypothetical protein